MFVDSDKPNPQNYDPDLGGWGYTIPHRLVMEGFWGCTGGTILGT